MLIQSSIHIRPIFRRWGNLERKKPKQCIILKHYHHYDSFLL